MFVLLILAHFHIFLPHIWFLADVTITQVLDWINKGGVLAVLVFILYGGWRKWWVFGWVFNDSERRNNNLEKERDDWRDLALQGTNLAEQTVGLFKRSKGNS